VVDTKLLVDTHILIRWLEDPKHLTREQVRVLNVALQHREPVGLSVMSLLEIAFLVADGKLKLRTDLNELVETLESDPVYRILPLSPAIAIDAAALRALRDMGDRVIAATARVHGLRLVTSDSRIIDSDLVSTVH
jgi:PIN domain nuclease of toxin-antitoxin system